MVVLGVLNIVAYFVMRDGASMDVSTADIVWNAVSSTVLVLGAALRVRTDATGSSSSPD